MAQPTQAMPCLQNTGAVRGSSASTSAIVIHGWNNMSQSWLQEKPPSLRQRKHAIPKRATDSRPRGRRP
jgi:hypothetical protein